MKRLWLIVAILALVGGGCVPYYYGDPYYYGPSYYGYSYYRSYYYGPYYQPYWYYRPPAVVVDPGRLLYSPHLYRGYGYRGYGYRGYYPRHGGRWY